MKKAQHLQHNSLQESKVLISQPAGLAMLHSGGDWKFPAHLQLLNSKLLQVASGKIKRLIINMPPQHGKSEFTSKYFPVWYLATHPKNKLILSSYETNFAISWGRKAREVFDETVPDNYGIQRNMRVNVQGNWETEQGGYMYCVGVGGGITGRGADMLIIDDPVKNNEQAMSQVYRDKTVDWFQSVASTRLSPNASVIIIMTRWHPDDLAGHLIKHGQKGGEQWEVLSLPAIAEANDPMGRDVGEALWKDRYDTDTLIERKKQVGDFWFTSMYQQKPYVKGGRVFADANFYDKEPDGGVLGFSVDFAYSTKSYSDYSVIGIGKWFNKKLYIIDWWRGQTEASQFASVLKNFQVKYDVPIHCYIGGTERGIVDFLKREHNLRIIEKPARGDKFTRAQPVAAAWNDGRVLLPTGKKFTNDMVQEICSFTGLNDVHDDQVDTISALYDSLNRNNKPMWRIT